MGTMKMGLPNDYFGTVVAYAKVQGSVTSISITGGVATATQTSHGYATGDLVTFSGITGTGVTGLNGAHWQVTSTGANTYTFITSLTGTVGGTILAQPIYLFTTGEWQILNGVNGIVEYNPDNTVDSAIISSQGVVGTWRSAVPVSTSAFFHTDGYAYRFRANGTTATSYFSPVL